MDHHIVANIDTHMGNSIGVIGSLKEHKITGFDIGAGNGSADVVQTLRSQSANIPATVIDNPGHETGTVEGCIGIAAAPHIGVAQILLRFLDHRCEHFVL